MQKNRFFFLNQALVSFTSSITRYLGCTSIPFIPVGRRVTDQTDSAGGGWHRNRRHTDVNLNTRDMVVWRQLQYAASTHKSRFSKWSVDIDRVITVQICRLDAERLTEAKEGDLRDGKAMSSNWRLSSAYESVGSGYAYDCYGGN